MADVIHSDLGTNGGPSPQLSTVGPSPIGAGPVAYRALCITVDRWCASPDPVTSIDGSSSTIHSPYHHHHHLISNLSGESERHP